MMATHDLRIDIDLRALITQLQRSLQQTVVRVSATMKNIVNINANELELDTFQKTHFCSNIDVDDECVKNDVESWILCNVFRDLVEMVNLFLEEVHKVLSIWDLSIQFGTPSIISSSDCNQNWNKHIDEHRAKFHWMGIAQKINHLIKEHELHLNQVLVQHVQNANMIRNCLAHRAGIVGADDCTADGEIILTWRHMVFVIKTDTEDRIAQCLSGNILILMSDL